MATLHNSTIYDPHLHLFYLDEGDYFWLKNALPPWPKIAMLQKSFSEEDLDLNNEFVLSQFTHIEAGFNNQQAEKEIAFLERKIGKKHSAIGYCQIDVEPSLFKQQLNTLLSYSTFVGIRDITEGSDAARLHSENVTQNFAFLAHNKLIFEAQFEISERQHTTRIYELAKAQPNLDIVLNHAGLVTPNNYSNWLRALKQLSQLPNVYIKYSGFEMQEINLSDTFRNKVFDAIFTNFSRQRILFGSNFPVCLMASSYLALWQHYRALCPDGSVWQKLACDNAKALYSN